MAKKFPIKDLDHPLKYKWNKTFDYNWNTKSDQKNWVLPKVLKDQASLIPDKDFLQLVDDRISVWSPTKKKLYKPEQVMEEYGIPSHNLLTVSYTHLRAHETLR